MIVAVPAALRCTVRFCVTTTGFTVSRTVTVAVTDRQGACEHLLHQTMLSHEGNALVNSDLQTLFFLNFLNFKDRLFHVLLHDWRKYERLRKNHQRKPNTNFQLINLAFLVLLLKKSYTGF